jgi:hypothetical protein
MHMKVTEILGAALVFTFPMITSLERKVCLCFLSSSDKRMAFWLKVSIFVFNNIFTLLNEY